VFGSAVCLSVLVDDARSLSEKHRLVVILRVRDHLVAIPIVAGRRRADGLYMY